MRSLQGHFDSLLELYGPRNGMYMYTHIRAPLLFDAIRHFSELVRRKESDKVILARALASIFARTWLLADSFYKLEIVNAMCEKYPADHCAYCQKKPCVCQEHRARGIEIATVDSEQMNWSVAQWCLHLDAIYGRNNRERGIQTALLRLIQEVSESQGAQLLYMYNPNRSQQQLRHATAQEFADVFAWIFSISAMLGLDLGAMIEGAYGSNCRRCESRPCICGPYWTYSNRSSGNSQVAGTRVVD